MSKFSFQMTLRELLSNEETKAVFYKYLGDMIDSPMVQAGLDMTIEALKPYTQELIPADVITAIEQEINNII